MAKLILRRGDGSEQEVSLDEKGSVTIGRSPDCDLPIDESQSSRRHCSVVKLQSGYEVSDLGSTNGTLVNSQLVKRKKLAHGDVIKIGKAEIVFSDPGSAAAVGEMQNCFLVYAKGERKGERIELTQPRTTIGRRETNTVVLKDNVASSYHCEIVRDLNGYTVRDLGSTNGTLVNNEMVTEAQLAHGARLRIGNVRFVFQDPALAEVDLELAGVDDDESEWGMMRELDLAAVRRRNPATVVYALLFVAILGGGGYMMTLQGAAKGATGPVAPAGNLHPPWSFESRASVYSWDSEMPGAVSVRSVTKPRGDGEFAIELQSNVPEVDVFYVDSHDGREKRFELSAKVGTSGARGTLGLLWLGLGLTEWMPAATVSGTMTQVSLTRGAPPWANGVRIGVRIEGKGSVYLDDVSLVAKGPRKMAEVVQSDFRITTVDGRSLDIQHAGAPILAKGRLFLRDGKGREMDASGVTINVEETGSDQEHVIVTLDGAGEAASAGVELEEVRGYLTRGGFRAFGYSGADEDQTYFQASFPESGAPPLQEVRKLLLGDAGRAFAVIGATEADRLQSETRTEGRKNFWSILGAPKEGKFAFRIKTDLRGESVTANERISEALHLHKSNRWGEFLGAAQRTRAEFPFAPKSLLDQLAGLERAVNQSYGELDREADAMLLDYEEFNDMQSLDRVAEIVALLKGTYQIVPGQGPRGERLEKVAQAEAQKRAKAERQRQGEIAKPLLELALYVNLPEGETYSAAVLLAYIRHYLDQSPQAAEAAKEMAKIEKAHPEVVAVLEGLGIGGK